MEALKPADNAHIKHIWEKMHRGSRCMGAAKRGSAKRGAKNKMKTKRKAISKSTRTSVYLMYNGHCAYCGKEIKYKDMQVDHKKPLRLGGINDITNYLPACRSCNHYKSTLDVEGYSKYLQDIHKRLMRDSIPYQVAERFGIVKHISNDILFYFEKVNR